MPDRLVVSGTGAVLLATLATGVLWQAGVHPDAQRMLGFGICVALGTSLTGHGRAARPGRALPLVALPALPLVALPALPLVALAAWMLAGDALRGAAGAGGREAAVAAGAAAVVIVLSRAPVGDREALDAVLPAVGVIVAATAWLGLVLHLPRWGLLAAGVWRGSGATSYPNATAALLVMLALATLVPVAVTGNPGAHGAHVDPGATRRSPAAVRAGRLAGTAMLIGAGATLSRGGAVALAVGVAVTVAFVGGSCARALAGPLIGAAVGVSGLVPATTSSTAGTRLTGLLAPVTGLLVAELLSHCTGTTARHGSGAAGPGWGRGQAPLAVAFLLAGGTAAGVALTGPDLSALAAARLSTSTTHRAQAAGTALSRIAAHPLTGVGTRDAPVTWHDPSGASLTEAYTHNEYLQVALEHGALGGGLLLLTLLVAAVDVTVTYTCAADSMGIWVALTQAIGRNVASGGGFAMVGCDGGTHRTVVRVEASPSGKAFKTGPVSARTDVNGCTRHPSWMCGNDSTSTTFRITK